MTLREFSNNCFAVKGKCEIIVVDYELEPEDFDESDNLDRLFTLKSSFLPEYYLKEAFANAEVQEVYALERDKFLVQVKGKKGR